MLGASGYTGADMIRLAARHPAIKITALIAKGHAGHPLAQVFPHLASLDLPPLVTSDQVDWSEDRRRLFADCRTAPRMPRSPSCRNVSRVIDMSADFRLRDPRTLCRVVWRRASARRNSEGRRLRADRALSRQDQDMRGSLPAPAAIRPPCCSRCCRWPRRSSSLADDIIIDAKSGVSGAGRTLKQNILFSETGEGLSPYGIGSHRHVPEIEQELGLAARRCRHRQLHAASRADVARRAVHLLCAGLPAKRRLTGLRSRFDQSLRGEPVRPRGRRRA